VEADPARRILEVVPAARDIKWPLTALLVVATVTLAVDLLGVGESWSLIGHPIIAISYLTLALTFQFVRLPSASETWAIRIGAALFFLGCAMHHIEMWGHIVDGEPLDAAALHHALPTTMQVVGAPMFLLALGPYISDFVWLLRTPHALVEVRRQREAEVR
jgi:hypothetical protein